MRETFKSGELLHDPEIEKTARRLRKEAKIRRENQTQAVGTVEEIEPLEEMAEQQPNLIPPAQQQPPPNGNGQARVPLGAFIGHGGGAGPSIVRPPIQAQDFELKPALVTLVRHHQFGGSAFEDPNAHIIQFLQICDTVKNRYVMEDAIRLRLFPFSLRDKAKHWLDSLPSGSITNWENLQSRFFSKFFPASKTSKLRSEITSFSQNDGESLHEAWERYKELMRKCPQHGLPDWVQIDIFRNGLSANLRLFLDAAAGGSLNTKTKEEAEELIETLAENSYSSSERNPSKGKGIAEKDTLNAILAQMEKMNLHLAQNQVSTPVYTQPNALCAIGQANCAGEGVVVDANLQEHVQFLARWGQPQNSNFGTWKNHPGFQWSNPNGAMNQTRPQQVQQQPAHVQPTDKPTPLETSLHHLTAKLSDFATNTNNFITESRATSKNHEAMIHNLENQIGQLSQQLQERMPGSLPSDTVVNPKEQCKMVRLRSGKEILSGEARKGKEKDKERETTILEPHMNEPTLIDSLRKAYSHLGKVNPSTLDSSNVTNLDGDDIAVSRGAGKDSKFGEASQRLPYPTAVKKNEQDKQYERFLEIFKQIHVNIPLLEVMEQMPSYTKFLKDLLSKKRRLKDDVDPTWRGVQLDNSAETPP